MMDNFLLYPDRDVRPFYCKVEATVLSARVVVLKEVVKF